MMKQESPLFTSDYPAAIETFDINTPINRIVPFAPDIAVRIKPDISLSGTRPDITFAKCNATSRHLKRAEVLEVNRLLVRCAEDLIFFRDGWEWIDVFVSPRTAGTASNRDPQASPRDRQPTCLHAPDSCDSPSGQKRLTGTFGPSVRHLRERSPILIFLLRELIHQPRGAGFRPSRIQGSIASHADRSSVHHAPAPQVPAPQVPAPQVPAPQVPAPQVPAPQVPAPQVPAHQVPAHQVVPGAQRHGRKPRPAADVRLCAAARRQGTHLHRNRATGAKLRVAARRAAGLCCRRRDRAGGPAQARQELARARPLHRGRRRPHGARNVAAGGRRRALPRARRRRPPAAAPHGGAAAGRRGVARAPHAGDPMAARQRRRPCRHCRVVPRRRQSDRRGHRLARPLPQPQGRRERHDLQRDRGALRAIALYTWSPSSWCITRAGGAAATPWTRWATSPALRTPSWP